MSAQTLAEALTGLSVGGPISRGPACTVKVVLDELAKSDPAAHAALAGIIDNPAIPATRIASALGPKVNVFAETSFAPRSSEGSVPASYTTDLERAFIRYDHNDAKSTKNGATTQKLRAKQGSKTSY